MNERKLMFTRTSFQDGSLSKEERQRGPAVWTFRWRETGPDGKRVKRKLIIGSVEKYRSETHARKALPALDLKINQERRDAIHPALITVGQLIEHYKERELSDKRTTKAESTCEVYGFYIDRWLMPSWKDQRVQAIKTVAVEEWLRSLPLADGSKSKLRNIFSAIFNHGIRHELALSNPITGSGRGSGVRQSAKRRRDPDVLSPEEMRANSATFVSAG
jgi:integrase